jgi:hypothetical protein
MPFTFQRQFLRKALPAGLRLNRPWHNIAGAPGQADFRLFFLNCIRDPNQLQPTMHRIVAEFQKAAQKKQK